MDSAVGTSWRGSPPRALQWRWLAPAPEVCDGRGDLTPARALRRPRRADPRALIGICLTLVALAGSCVWVGNNEARRCSSQRAITHRRHPLPGGPERGLCAHGRRAAPRRRCPRGG